jgi:hypothetical protein
LLSSLFKYFNIQKTVINKNTLNMLSFFTDIRNDRIMQFLKQL